MASPRSSVPAVCCPPARASGEGHAARAPAASAPTARAADTSDMVMLDGGPFTMGSDDALALPEDGEGARPARVAPFAIDACAVTNERFAAFVAATAYVTDAERFGWSFVFGGLLPDDFPPTRGVAAAPWWRQVHDATWRRPEGPRSEVGDRADHPVVHV